ncbi:MAG: phosphatidylserine decarboxylase [Acidiferrobacteraceae bacterium]
MNPDPALSETLPPARSHPVIAREGWVHIVLAIAAAIAAYRFLGPAESVPLWLIVLFIVQFFRDPARPLPAAPRLVVCPADGRVVALGPVFDPYLQRPAVRVSIFMNVFNVHSNRAPVSGVIRRRWYQRGSFVNAALDKASERNERNALWVRTDNGADVVVVQIAGLIARRILCYVAEAARVERGERYGFIRFGSRVDLYLPEDVALRVALGDKVQGGRDVVAVLA